MKKYFEQLNPMERRLVVGVAVVVLLVLNFVYIWPHFSDWGKFSRRLDSAHRKLALYRSTTNKIPQLEAEVKKYESAGQFVAPADQGINLMRTIQSQSAQCGVSIVNNSRQISRSEDPFFVEQEQNINVLATEQNLVNFLYKLGSDASMIRVRDLELQPDRARQRLTANIRLVASYQKKPATPAKPSTAKAK